MRDLIQSLRSQLAELKAQNLAPIEQEGIWNGIKKIAHKVASAADTAVSAIPVAGTVYDAGVGAYKAQKALVHTGQGIAQTVMGKKKAAAKSFQKAKNAGVDAAGRVAGVAASVAAPGVGGAVASVATKSIAKPLVKAAAADAFKTGVKALAKTGANAAHQVINRAAAPKPGIVKRKPVFAPPPSSESVLFPSALALVEFRSMAGLPITEEHQTQLEAEETAVAATK